MAVPTFPQLMNPILQALRQLGGSGSVQEIESAVSKIIDLPEKDTKEIHRGSVTKLEYRLAWARNYLKRYGLLENSSRGVWSLTAKGAKSGTIDPRQVDRFVHRLDHREGVGAAEKEEEPLSWKEQLLGQIMGLSAAQFERLCQRLLREAGFIQVEVLGRSGDGGVDGRGVMQLGGFLSFRVIFQCKRYKGAVSPKEIRDFRGAMVGRADKGLFITTGTFTKDAWQEATRDGAPPLDLVDGEQLALKMKELALGTKTRSEEVVEVDPTWFERFKV